MSLPEEAALQELFKALEQTRTANYVAVSAIAFMAYEITSKFDMEVKHIWMYVSERTRSSG
ncbi:hypothetical protein B0H10DRAFT_2207065 [Mycena sp. CBHHK59/15]|nr:hypothetical protein B0H10DRAFT_2207065 [Mycena sp. CBHHK59/15]